MRIGDTVMKKLTIPEQPRLYPGKVIYLNRHFYVVEFSFPKGKLLEAYAYKELADESMEH